MAGLGAAAVVINMVFLYPYTLARARVGARSTEASLALRPACRDVPALHPWRPDLMVIATANTIHARSRHPGQEALECPRCRRQVLSGTLGDGLGTGIFLFGLLGMVMTTITMHMVSAAFAISEMFGLKFGSRGYRLALLIPTPGFLGAFYWSDMAVWVAVPTSIATAALLPIAYFGFIKLQRSPAYLGENMPRGKRARTMIGAMVFGTTVVVVFLVWTLITKL